MEYVYIVHVEREGDSGADMLPVGVYANEFVAKRVARSYSGLFWDERITVGAFPVLTDAVELVESGHEPACVYSRAGEKDPQDGSPVAG